MKLEININATEGHAGLAIRTDEGLEVQWTDLQKEDQIGIINTLYGFTEIFYKSYVTAHGSEPENNQEPPANTEENGD